MSTDNDLYMLDVYFAILHLVSSIGRVHQLYLSVKNKTDVQAELRMLKEANLIRVFSCRLGSDIFAIMLIDDYCDQLNKQLQDLGEVSLCAVVEYKFLAWVRLNHCFSVIISRQSVVVIVVIPTIEILKDSQIKISKNY